MKRGIVVAVHPQDHSVDLILSDGRRLVGVQVMTSNGSTRSGVVDMPAVPAKSDKWDIAKPTGQDQVAIVDFVDGIPVVIGFLIPQISQMTFDDVQRKFTRHQSDVTTSIDSKGAIQVQHPCGFYVRIAEDTALEDLTGKNSDKSLKLDRNKDKKVGIHVQTATGSAFFSMRANGSIAIKASGGVTIDAPQVTVTGDVIAGGISLMHHTHGGVKAGGDRSGQP